MSKELIHTNHYEDKSLLKKMITGIKRGFQYVTGTYNTHVNIESREKMIQENQKFQALLATYNHEQNKELQTKLQDRNLTFQKAQNEVNRQAQLKIAQLAQQTARYEGEQNRLLQTELAHLQRKLATEEGKKNRQLQKKLQKVNLAFQKAEGNLNREHAKMLLQLQLDVQRALQIELKEVEYEYAKMLAVLHSKNQLENFKQRKQIEHLPLRMLVEDILGATDSNRAIAPLYIFIAPSKLQYDTKGNDNTQRLDIENLIDEYTRKIVGMYQKHERSVLFKGGAWKTKAAKAETAIQSIFNFLRSQAILVLESNESSNQNYQMNVGTWAAHAPEPRFETFFSFSWNELLRECIRINAPLHYAEYEEEKESGGLDFLDEGWKRTVLNNYKIVEYINKKAAKGKEVKLTNFNFKSLPEDVSTLHHCLALYHGLTIALMIDQHFLLNMPPSLRQPPLLPKIFDEYVEETGVPSELVVKLWLPCLVENYKACYDSLSLETGVWAEDLQAELIEALTYFKDKSYALEVLKDTLKDIIDN